jgi:hypothetical protein
MEAARPVSFNGDWSQEKADSAPTKCHWNWEATYSWYENGLIIGEVAINGEFLFNDHPEVVQWREQLQVVLAPTFATAVIPQDRIDYLLDRLVPKVASKLRAGTYQPKKYHTPAGARLFSVLPLYSLQKRHMPISGGGFGQLLGRAGREGFGDLGASNRKL